MRGHLILALFTLLALFSASCGPGKTTMLYLDVEKTLKQARDNHADRKVDSVYYYYAAGEYLRKCKQEHGYSRFLASERYGLKAKSLARKAVETSEKESAEYVEPDLKSFKKTKKNKQKDQ